MDFEHKNLDQAADYSDQNHGQDFENINREASFNTTMDLQAVGSNPSLEAGAQNTVDLPVGVELDDIRLFGHDLVIEMPDGIELVILDGAASVPQIVIGGVAVPPANLAAVFTLNATIERALGPLRGIPSCASWRHSGSVNRCDCFGLRQRG